MTERVWDRFLTEQDKAHLAATPDRRAARLLRDVPALADDISRKQLTWATLQ